MSAIDGLRFDPGPECAGCGGLNTQDCTNSPDCTWSPRPLEPANQTHEDRDCHEAVIRDGEEEPCERPAVGYRLDPEHGTPYPVCRKHHRPPYWLTARAATTEGNPKCKTD